jgi:hypothetical protein|tara:strand:+ start:942 stop:1169 length:228 start_codon:yes stop_codon:yes gene_type:complete
MKNKLKIRISKIHAVKTNKTSDCRLANDSYYEQKRLKLILDDLNENDDFTKIINEINLWAGSNPIATERAIKKLM